MYKFKTTKLIRNGNAHFGEIIGGATCIGRVDQPDDPDFGKYRFICPLCGNNFNRELRYMHGAEKLYPDRLIDCGCDLANDRVRRRVCRTGWSSLADA